MTTTEEFLASQNEAKKQLIENARRSGPQFDPGGLTPGVWGDQVFGRGITPSGETVCPTALRAGSTANRLDVALIAARTNEGPLTMPADSTITCSFQTADSQDGTFSQEGPTITIKAGASGMSADPDLAIARFPIGNFKKPWLKLTLTFTGSITGGKLDAALAITGA